MKSRYMPDPSDAHLARAVRVCLPNSRTSDAQLRRKQGGYCSDLPPRSANTISGHTGRNDRDPTSISAVRFSPLQIAIRISESSPDTRVLKFRAHDQCTPLRLFAKRFGGYGRCLSQLGKMARVFRFQCAIKDRPAHAERCSVDASERFTSCPASLPEGPVRGVRGLLAF